MLKKAKERDLWQSIDYRFMTDESEGEDDKGEFVLRHPLPWRSKSKSWCIRFQSTMVWQYPPLYKM